MLIKTILNRIEKFKSFVYGTIKYEKITGEDVIVVEVLARKNSKGKCPKCGKCCSTYDTQGERDYEYVPIWGKSYIQ